MNNIKLTRRELLQKAPLAVMALAGLSAGCQNAQKKSTQTSRHLPPVRTITGGPKFHWFGYYDKLQFDPTGRYVLGMEVDFEHKSPKPDDVIKIGMVDLKDNNNNWIELGCSSAWCWQQGCMLQWRPDSKTEILWNDRSRDHYVCHILDVETGRKRSIPHPVYSVAPDGMTAVTLDFSRLNDMRPGYGYVGMPDSNARELAPKDSGLWKVDLETGERKLLISIAEVAGIAYPHDDLSKKKHYFNHLLINPDGTRFEFLHRWFPRGQRDCRTRMLTAAMDGSEIRVIDQSGCTSHFIWRDAKHILAWSWHDSPNGCFCLFEDKNNGSVEVVGRGFLPTRDGHCSYLPDKDWILCDTYPDKERKQTPYLYHIPSRKIFPLGHFYSPPEYKGEWRVDAHPRFSPDGHSVVIDSPHTGCGRQMHLIDIRGIVG